MVAPYRAIREEFKKIAPVFEVYLKTDEIRKGAFFAKDYEKPEVNFLEIDTGKKILTSVLI